MINKVDGGMSWGDIFVIIGVKFGDDVYSFDYELRGYVFYGLNFYMVVVYVLNEEC